MKVVIIGPGALGCFMAASLTIKLARSNKNTPPLDLWLLDYRPARARQLKENGLILEENNQKKLCWPKITADHEEVGPADIIMLCLKSPQVGAGLRQASQLIKPDTLLVTLQNGIGHLKLLKEKTNLPKVVLGITAQGANMVAPGHVRHAGTGLTRIGFLESANSSGSLLLARLGNLLNCGGIETVIVDNILDHVWSKLLINVGINALTAIYRCPNGRLLESGTTQKKLIAAVKEAETVARTLGIQLSGDPLALTIDVCKSTAQNLSSMLQDVNNKRPTEIDAINGEIVAAGKKLGIPTPVNYELLQKIKEIEQTY